MSEVEGRLSCNPHCAETDIESNVKVSPNSASLLDAETVQNTNVNTNSSLVEESLDDNALLNGLLTDNFCHVCEAVLQFESQRISHYEGKKHAQRVRLYLQTKKSERQGQDPNSFQRVPMDTEKFCELCNMVFSSPVVAKSHYEGKVHAKNMKKNSVIPSKDEMSSVGASVSPPCPVEGAREGMGQELKDSSEQSSQEVDLSDPNKYCRMCAASFNNPLMAQQHYSGRKHQRNQSRQQLLDQLQEQPDLVNSLTCPVCCITFNSVEPLQAHMQGNKHRVKEKKVSDLCKSQKKVYGSFQDELDDYIQVQKARGLEPRMGQKEPEEREAQHPSDNTQREEQTQKLSPPSCTPPVPGFPPPLWCPPFPPPNYHCGFGPRGPEPYVWGQGYSVPPPPLIPGLTGRAFNRGRNPESYSSSSFSDSSSYSSSRSRSSSSSSNSSDYSREKRRKKKRRERRRKIREPEEEEEEEEEKEEERETDRRRNKRTRGRDDEEDRDDAKRARRRERRRRRASLDDEEGMDEEKERRKRRERTHQDSESAEDEKRRRRSNKRSKKHKRGHHAKGHREESGGKSLAAGGDRLDKEKGEAEDRIEGSVEERAETKEERSKHRKEKRKTKEKTDKGDSRTEEEKLWDETILGLF
ncbi:zinc finger matrin-type protein 1 [Chanos chanos]|uniref:Zinc finger matrin-type protein 1 n=1 Tax=Chanos chanos TaxID=29144 RepID=A0A6J2UYC2_CHACN|nr:zinc finger matrin-type protein 1-like [Chanos chanos]